MKVDWVEGDDSGSGKYLASEYDREASLETDVDDRLWAAAELYITTGRSSFADYFADYFNEFDQHAASQQSLVKQDLGADAPVEQAPSCLGQHSLASYAERRVAPASRSDFASFGSCGSDRFYGGVISNYTLFEWKDPSPLPLINYLKQNRQPASAELITQIENKIIQRADLLLERVKESAYNIANNRFIWLE